MNITKIWVDQAENQIPTNLILDFKTLKPADLDSLSPLIKAHQLISQMFIQGIFVSLLGRPRGLFIG